MKLFKLDSKGKIRTLDIYPAGAALVQVSGLEFGKKVTNTKICKGKNIGKINETTPEQQAQSEASNKIKIKLTEGYFDNREDARSKLVILPMLAKDYKKESQKIDWSKPVFAQPKLDGMRCLAFLKGEDVDLKSRKNKSIDTMKHIQEALSFVGENIILDGELYVHGLSFQENMKLIKKESSTSNLVNYHIYDIVWEDSFVGRLDELIDVFNSIGDDTIKLVETIRIKSEQALKDLHIRFLKEGYEGTIIRHGEEHYKNNGRSSSLLKYKDFMDESCEIIDIVPSESRPNQGVLVCTFKGKKFRASLKFPHAVREEILTNKSDYIKKQVAEIRFFELTDDGIPRFPVCVGFRLDK